MRCTIHPRIGSIRTALSAGIKLMTQEQRVLGTGLSRPGLPSRASHVPQSTSPEAGGGQRHNWEWGRVPALTIPVLCGGVGLGTISNALNEGNIQASSAIEAAAAPAPQDASPALHPEWLPPAVELTFKADLYGGILIDAESLPTDPAIFKEVMATSLAKWKGEKKRGVWVTIPSGLASHIPLAVSMGFQFHHANTEAVTMAHWLPDTPNKLPHNASHYVGIGVAVVDSQDRILVVQEKSGPAAARGKDFWKVPTGLVDPNESIADAAEREVFEETGIRVKFDGVIAFREQHKSGVEKKTDLFFMCKAVPLSSEIVMQESELASCKWMPAEEYANLPLWAEGSAYWVLNRLGVEQALQGRLELTGPRVANVPVFTAKKLPRGHGTGHLHIYSGMP